MTVVVAARFQDGAVVLADTRASWGLPADPFPEDALQKILPLTRKSVIAYAGDVAAAAYVIERIKERIQRKKRLQSIYRLAGDLPRAARHYFREFQSKSQRVVGGIALVLAGISDVGKALIYWTESPHFSRRRLDSELIAVGSGDFVLERLQAEVQRYRDQPTLKARADEVMMDVTRELERHGERTVGGMFQGVVLDSTAIRPLSTGFIDLNLEGPSQARYMECAGGQWTQTDLATGRQVPVDSPARFLGRNRRIERLRDLRSPQSLEAAWHVTYFLTTFGFRKDSGTSEFHGVFSEVLAGQFPLETTVLVAMGFWASTGDHELELVFERGGNREVIDRAVCSVEFMPEEKDFVREIPLRVDSPGQAFLEVRIGGRTVARRALYFGQIAGAPPADAGQQAAFLNAQRERILSEHRELGDPAIDGSGVPQLIYFTACERCEDNGWQLRFERQVAAGFSSTYPLVIAPVVGAAFRAPRGRHEVKVELVNAASRNRLIVDTATAEISSSAIPAKFVAPVRLTVPVAGLYLLTLTVGGQTISSRVIAFEGVRSRFSYELTPEDSVRVQNGEVLLLVKDSSPSAS
jgi:20S proteasome alpha/beta subunit